MNLPAKLRQLASQENHDGEPYDSLIQAATEIDRLRDEIAVQNGHYLQVMVERDQLARWKKEALIVEDWWKEIDTFVRAHPSLTIGAIVADEALRMLKERDVFEADRDGLRKAEAEVSDAYLRIRGIVGSWKTLPGGEDRFAITESAIRDLMAENAELKKREHSIPKISEWSAFKHSTEIFEWKMAIEGPDFTMFTESKSMEGLGRTFGEKVKEDAERDAFWNATTDSRGASDTPERDEAILKCLKAQAERDEARHALLTLHAREHLTCGWCGDMMHAPPGFTPPMTSEKMKQTVKIHMLDCPKHPIRETERELEELREEVRLTLMENLHLADGDVCTLKRLKDAISFELPTESES